jgi:ribose transport system permease protein
VSSSTATSSQASGRATGPESTKTADDSGRPLVAELAERFGLLVIFAAIILFFGIWGRTGSIFLSHANIIQIIGNQMVVLLVALAAMIPLNSGYFDLSSGATVGTASVACATSMSRFHLGVFPAVLIGVVAGALIGLIDGILIARFKLSAVITTLAMSTALTGLMQWYTSGETISTNVSLGLQNFGSLNWIGIPRLAFVVVPVVLFIWYLQEWTPWGRYQQAISSSDRSARLVGIGVDRLVLASFVLGGAVAGVAGVLLVARSGGADSTTGPSYLFPALAAVFLGATTIRPGRPNTLGTVVGIFFVAFSVSGLTLTGASAWVSDLFNGLALFAAAGLATVFARQRGGKRLF